MAWLHSAKLREKNNYNQLNGLKINLPHFGLQSLPNYEHSDEKEESNSGKETLADIPYHLVHGMLALSYAEKRLHF